MLKIYYSAAIILTVFSMSSINTAIAETVINNYSSQPQQTQTPAPAPAASGSNSNCNQSANNNNDNGMPAGVYTTPNGNGGTNTLYTTGDKKPFIADNTCNNNTSGVQPYVEYNMPGSGSTGSTSGSSSTGSTSAPAASPMIPTPLRR